PVFLDSRLYLSYKRSYICSSLKEVAVDAIYADFSVSMSEFKKNPAQVLRTAGEKPVAVLNHNRPAFYMVTPKLFEALIEELADRDLVELARQRLAKKAEAIEVDLEQL
ncbi:MAG TPA: type II toxin-antitoxin system prevent-host-death family antitoxin, partial [Thauera aminoaromatica]|nr:type II toxin-antitoxin system prevent-host-death family antitoxin [Thauera aminoaromatica]